MMAGSTRRPSELSRRPGEHCNVEVGGIALGRHLGVVVRARVRQVRERHGLAQPGAALHEESRRVVLDHGDEAWQSGCGDGLEPRCRLRVNHRQGGRRRRSSTKG